MATFYPCPQNFPEIKFKSNRLISLVEDIAGQSNIDSFMLLVITLMQVYNENEQVGKNKYKMYILKKKEY